MSEQGEADFPGFPGFPESSHSLMPAEGPSLASYCPVFEGTHGLGPAMCVSMQFELPVPAPGFASYGFGIAGPAIAIVPSLLFLVFVIALFGFLFGFYTARRKTLQMQVPELSPGLFQQWRYERNTTILTFLLVAAGLVFFVLGASGSVELEIPHVRVVTSAPGLVLILFGYMFWVRRYSCRPELPEIEGNDSGPSDPLPGNPKKDVPLI